MQYKANSPEDYIRQLPEERQAVISKIRQTILNAIPQGFEEQLSYGMLGYVVPHSLYPDGYHCDPKLPLPFINLASQKNFVALYHSGIYADQNLYDWFVEEYPKHCKRKLDMGKSCIRFKYMEDIPYELIKELCTKMTVSEWIDLYEKNIKR
ncbi:DUF1801 domain-containing protein [Aggregatimonas sangjinii]|uniref:DUF1801 domain-containing protein n=1 Tax=Aggregatimonas sangjinii TaxID=2583587 RepID=A0A5B7SRT0_9FLAO|nr:DUF1801 domain-containing protein [Aggregatimonas sangjinii]QCX01395.1 DUF1801 domain-containing protein [Aggregatimonas sangjinii]